MLQSLKYSSFGVVGPRLFNVLPVNIRNISGCSVETCKLHFDRFLATVPDEPQVRGYTAMRRAESNSLLHMAQLAGPNKFSWRRQQAQLLIEVVTHGHLGTSP